jgi:hypothetical protein
MEATKKRERYQSDPDFRDRLLTRNGQWKRENSDAVREHARQYRLRNTEREAARKKAWKAANPERQREYVREHYWRNPEKFAHRRAQRAPQQASSQLRWKSANADYVKQVKRAYEDGRERVVNPKAVNARAPWTDAEVRIALNPALSEVEAALMLGRTVRAVSNKRYKARRRVLSNN